MGSDGVPELEPNTVEARQLTASIRATGRNDDALRDLHLDVRRAIATLCKNDRVLARRLMRSSITEIVQTTRIPRSTIYERIKRIRNGFITAGVSRRFGDTRTVLDPTE
jgi:hypothetical protein